MRNLLIVLISLFLIAFFSGCQKEGKTHRPPKKKLETRQDSLLFYRAQIVALEADIDYHLKHSMALNLQNDYVRLQGSLKGLSPSLNEDGQKIVEVVLQEIDKTLVNFNKTKSFLFFSRGNEKIFVQLRKLKKNIAMEEKKPIKAELKEEKPQEPSTDTKESTDTQK